MAETVEEEAFCLELFGVRPVEYLEELGWLGDDVWLAHCVHLDDARDRALRRDAAPASRTARRRTRGWARGSRRSCRWCARARRSGSASTARRPTRPGELGGELRQALLVARLRGGPAAMTAHEALELGTLHGARCLGRDDELGTLEAGKLADVVLWRLDDLDHAGIARPGRRAGPRAAAAGRDA